jgi:hypothetical protein
MFPPRCRKGGGSSGDRPPFLSAQCGRAAAHRRRENEMPEARTSAPPGRLARLLLLRHPFPGAPGGGGGRSAAARAFSRSRPGDRLARGAAYGSRTPGSGGRGAAACRPRTRSPMPDETPHARPHRWTRTVVRAGALAALPLLAACGAARAPAGPLPQLAQYEGREVRPSSSRASWWSRRIRSAGGDHPAVAVPAARLHPRLPVRMGARPVPAGPGRAPARRRPHPARYRDAGYYGTRVFPLVDPARTGPAGWTCASGSSRATW